MIGAKNNLNAYGEAGRLKRQKDFRQEEILLSHYQTLSKPSQKLAKKYFEENIYLQNGFAKLKLNEAIDQYLAEVKANVPFPRPSSNKVVFTFIDLFAGIGGFRLAMQNLGGKCVFSSEWDKYAQQTYKVNFGEIPFGDITKSETKKFIPREFDLLCGGFPCQPFSLAGVTKKNSLGKKHGFDDEKQGNLFFHIAEIIDTKRPKAFLLENVKNLTTHDKKNTFKVIKTTLEGLGYSFDHKVLDGKYFVPQHRERTMMIGFRKDIFGQRASFDFTKLKLPEPDKQLKNILEENVDNKYTLTDHLWKYLQEYAKKHKEKGNGFGYGLADTNSISRTLSARYYKDGSEILIPQLDKNPRRLSIRECARLQGFPDNFIIDKVSMNQAYKQFGNSVVLPLIQTVGSSIVETLNKNKLCR